MSVRVESSGPVTTVILERPDVRNAVDTATAAALREAFAEFAAGKTSQGRALDMILTGREIAAAEALSWGLADRVVPDGATRRAAEQPALETARFPRLCMRADRYSLPVQWGRDIDDAPAEEAAGGIAPLETIADQIASFFAETEE